MMSEKNNKNDKKQLSGITFILDVFNTAKENNETETAELMAQVLKNYREHESIYETADYTFRHRLYPTFSLDWVKYFRAVGYKLRQSSDLNRYDTEILFFLCENMSTWNLIQVSARTLEDITGINKKTVIKSLNQLQKNGCIALQNKGVGTIPDTYMINPNIMIIGKDNSSTLESIFWSLTGTEIKYDNGKPIMEYSKPHAEWLNIINTKESFKVEKVSAAQIDNEEWNINKVDNIPVSRISKLKSKLKKAHPAANQNEQLEKN